MAANRDFFFRIMSASIGLSCLLLQGCGFVTAPLGQASVELLSSSLKTVDYSVERGSQAAGYLGDTVSAGMRWTVDSLDDLGSYLARQQADAIRRQRIGEKDQTD